MKQITPNQAEYLAFSNKIRLNDEVKYCQSDWIRENSRHIADIECKRADKTLYGEWPKGWKSEMIRSSIEAGKKNILERFLRDECKQLDGAIWLGNWDLIQEMERRTA